MSSGFLDQGGMTSKVLRSEVCPPSLGTSVLTLRTPNWCRPVGFYPSRRCYHTPECATFFRVCLTSLPSVAASLSLH